MPEYINDDIAYKDILIEADRYRFGYDYENCDDDTNIQEED